jgi:hypothetical protein
MLEIVDDMAFLEDGGGRGEKQIPFGNDRKKSKNNDKSNGKYGGPSLRSE